MAPRAILITAIAVIAVTFILVVDLLSAVIESMLPDVVTTSFSLTNVIGSILLAAATTIARLTSHSAQRDPSWAELGWPANCIFSSLSSWVGLGLAGMGLEAKELRRLAGLNLAGQERMQSRPISTGLHPNHIQPSSVRPASYIPAQLRLVSPTQSSPMQSS